MNDYDTFHFRQFTSKSEFEKALNSLKGIILGINIDEVVTEKEVKELNAWCLKHELLISRNPFKEIIEYVHEAIEDRILSQEEIEDLIWLFEKYEDDNAYYNEVTANIQILQGICHGILADGIVETKEILGLRNWLNDNRHLESYYPYDEIRSLISFIVSQETIGEDERLMIKTYLNQFVNIADKTVQQQIDEDISQAYEVKGICATNPTIVITDHRFCFTGASNRAKRSEIAKMIDKLGGQYINSVSKKLHYLIVGNAGNPCWAYSCYGRKVEMAMQLRKDGATTQIIHEDDFWVVLENCI